MSSAVTGRALNDISYMGYAVPTLTPLAIVTKLTLFWFEIKDIIISIIICLFIF